MAVHELEDWPVTGEVAPGGPDWLVDPAFEHFKRQTRIMGDGLREDHEVATVLDDRLVSADDVSLRRNRKNRTFRAKAFEQIGERKVPIAATLTVAGLLLAANQMRIHRKK